MYVSGDANIVDEPNIAEPEMSGYGTSRHFALPHNSGRYAMPRLSRSEGSTEVQR
jgi:hypothetical protein